MATKAEATFLKTCRAITGTGEFHSAGEAPFFFPKLHVRGRGEVSFPIHASQAQDLLDHAEAAPYGKGERTIYDEKVRKCGQIDASELSIQAPEWRDFLKGLLDRVREDMGIDAPISAHLYKLLIYGKGGHFRAHRDTEKLDAMFGTLLVALPSAHEGGRLSIRHDGREVVVDFSREAHRHEYQYAAFFADCEHEVEPVRSGFRCCLVFNLRLEGSAPAALNASTSAQTSLLTNPLATLKRDRAGELTAVLLEHSYTEANLSLAHLKGHDRNRARAILAAAEACGMHGHLALVTLHQSGELANAYDYYESRGRRSRRYWDDEPDSVDGSMGEIYEESLTLGPWRDAADRPVALGDYRIEPEALLPQDALEKSEPDEKEAEGYTGNAGCTMDYWYRRAAIVLWAKEDHARILCRYNIAGAAAELQNIAGKPRESSRFRELATALIERYPGVLPPPGSWIYRRRADETAADNPLLLPVKSLMQAPALDLLVALLAKIPGEQLSLLPTQIWRQIFQACSSEPIESLFECWLEQDDSSGLRTTQLRILEALNSAPRKNAHWIRRFALHLARSSPRWEGKQDDWHDNSDIETTCRDEARVLLAASAVLEENDEQNKVLTFLKADESLDLIRKVLGPVMSESSAAKLTADDKSVAAQLLAFMLSRLENEIGRPLLPFPDWRRPMPEAESDLKSRPMPHTRWMPKPPAWKKELADFLLDPNAEVIRFPRCQHERDSIESYIRTHGLDLDCETLKKGRPYTLLCTKNDRSHQLALEQRRHDEVLLGKLLALHRT